MSLDVLDYGVNAAITIILIVGGYQFYFFPQRRPIKKAKQFASWIDEKIPFKPYWVWIYSGLYYPVIVYVVITIDTFEKFNYTAFSFILLLLIQLVFFIVFPVSTPQSWRDYDKSKSISLKFLSFVHKFDSESNSFPSMHVSVATLCALHIYSNLSIEFGGYAYIAFAFPILISISTLYTKQHYVIDIPAGAVLGYGVFKLHTYIYA